MSFRRFPGVWCILGILAILGMQLKFREEHDEASVMRIRGVIGNKDGWLSPTQLRTEHRLRLGYHLGYHLLALASATVLTLFALASATVLTVFPQALKNEYSSCARRTSAGRDSFFKAQIRL
jgi:hypothetical protein